jgi:hypothetical protein
MKRVEREMWAWTEPDGRVVADSDLTEATAWRVGLGWPTRGEVKRAKSRGWRVVRVRVLIPAEQAVTESPLPAPTSDAPR